MKTVNVVQSISRAGGGLFYSVRRLTESLVELPGMRVAVHSLRDEFSDDDIRDWGKIRVLAHDVVGLNAFGYAPTMLDGLIAEAADLIHCHGIWMYPSIAATRWHRRTGRPYLISPHGMLDEWAVRNSAWKKRIVQVLYEAAFQRGAACIRVLCTAEANAVRQYGRKNQIVVIPNGVDLPAEIGGTAPAWRSELPAGALAMLYLGRIHPKKNLVNLIHAWNQVRRSRPQEAEAWYLVIAGWDQGGYRDKLVKLVEELSLQGCVRFLGPLYAEHKHLSLSSADAMVLPSLSEGVPMAILEAWAYRLPAVMTSFCNIPEGFEAKAAMEAGTDVPGIARGLENFMALNQEQRKQMGLAGRGLVESTFAWKSVAAQMAICYEWMLGSGAPPDSLFDG